MTGYDLTRKLRKTRRRYQLTATEQALFHELVAICNEDEWPDTFQCSNDELSRALNISENTLVSSRNTLIQSGLIAYKSGKSKRQFGTYSLSTTSNIEGDTGTVTGGDTGTNPCTNPDTNAADYYKTKQKSKNQTKHSVSNETGAGKNSDQLKAEKEKKSPPLSARPPLIEEKYQAFKLIWEKYRGSKKGLDDEFKDFLKKTPHLQIDYRLFEKEVNKRTDVYLQTRINQLIAKFSKDVTPHWAALIAVWFRFNQNEPKLNITPSFAGEDPRALKEICDNLQRRAIAKNKEWTQQMAEDTLLAFLTHAYKEDWLHKNFLLPNLKKQFDKIISNAGTTKNTNGRPATGSAVNTASAFDAIDKAFGGLGSGPNG